MMPLRLFRLLALLVLLWFAAVLGNAAPAASAAKPNVVVVLFDDLGWCQPRSYWPESEFPMPHFDRLAREGMRFTDAHSASGVCTPTRYGLLTGRSPWRRGQYGVLTTYSAPIIPTNRLTLASLLKPQGYHTACIGKWHLGLTWEGGRPGTEKSVPIGTRLREGPRQLGFDYFCGFTHARNIGTVIEQDTVVTNLAPVDNQPFLLRRALAYLEERARAGGPFLLYLPLGIPHDPVVPAPGFQGRSGVRDTAGRDPAYGDWMLQGDDALGQVLAALDRHGLSSNTVVVATSDNGAEGRVYPPLRASKRSIYEGGHRVPFVVRWPGRVPAGTVSDQTVSLNDLFATAAELAGAMVPPGAGEDSVSLVPAMLGRASGPLREGTVHQSAAGDLALRQGPWKLVFLKDGRRELYDVASDRRETRDVADGNPAVVARLAALMQRYIEEGRSTPGPPQRNEVTVTLGGKAAKAGRR
ncbi:MAG: hypothetical protein RJA22_2171 [Verrucomicrobiota bacterium]